MNVLKTIFIRVLLADYAKRKAYAADYYRRNKKRIAATQKSWVERNRSRSRAIKRAWEMRFPEKARECHNSYRRRQKITNPKFRVSYTLRSRFVKVLRSRALYHRRCSFRGVDIDAIVMQLEQKFLPGMNWANHGILWHIDHVIPCAEFDLTDPVQVGRCFHWLNLQPLWIADNMRKGAKVMRQQEMALV